MASSQLRKTVRDHSDIIQTDSERPCSDPCRVFRSIKSTWCLSDIMHCAQCSSSVTPLSVTEPGLPQTVEELLFADDLLVGDSLEITTYKYYNREPADP